MPRWQAVKKATGYGSTKCHELCRAVGLEPDEIVGRARLRGDWVMPEREGWWLAVHNGGDGWVLHWVNEDEADFEDPQLHSEAAWPFVHSCVPAMAWREIGIEVIY